MNKKHERIKGIINHLSNEIEVLEKLFKDLEYFVEKKVDEKIKDKETSLWNKLKKIKDFLDDVTRPPAK